MKKQRSSKDLDQQELLEWQDALQSVVDFAGAERASSLLNELNRFAVERGISASSAVTTPYLNTLSSAQQDALPDDGKLFKKIMAYLRWNAMAIVIRAGKRFPGIGGHIATYGSSGMLFEVGLTYFFRGQNQQHDGDMVFFQGHASPGIYARAFLEGRLTEQQLENFRHEAFADGLSSYPHPYLMPEFWQFPVVSMGLGAITGIYQAQFLKYLHHRGLRDTADRHVWVFCGDGEMGEPESLGALNIAARDCLDNLVFVISCNLQRLDGPVSGNSQIIQEYEGVFRGAGWHVIKVIWGGAWQRLFDRDANGLLAERFAALVDGEQQTYAARDGAYMREHFFARSPELLALVSDWSDEELKELNDGGHDLQQVYAAYAAAVQHQGKPTVILAKTTKGYGMGAGGEGVNVTHSTKKMSTEHLQAFCQRFDLPLTAEQIEQCAFVPLPKGSDEERYLHAQREQLGGYIPSRSTDCEALAVPSLDDFTPLLAGSGDREVSTTMVYVRLMGLLLKDKQIKERIVPILADETRTFGMEGLFRQIGIYAPFGQQYTPEDKSQLMYYREDQSGQLLQQGLSEAGSMASWTSAASAYANSNIAMIPFYIYYSMFGFQRIGDMVWAAGDIQARGFIMGATAGRTTLNGEGLQHEDGHNLIMFSMVPNCISYDPCFGYELTVIMQDGLRRMYAEQENVFYYLTLMNENYVQPALPKGCEEGILKGLYLLQKRQSKAKTKVRLIGGGTILREVIKAAQVLKDDYKVAAEVWSATSFNELRRDCEATARYNRLYPDVDPRLSHVAQCFAAEDSPIIAATDYMKMYADQVRQDITSPYYVLGTDGFGRSDTRENLRRFFEVDTNMIVYTALKALVDQGAYPLEKLLQAQQQLQIDVNRPDPDKS
jgi:pyruvate dehydrogenase E1 component